MEQATGENTGIFNPGEILGNARQVIMDPVGFFRRMPKKGGYAQPLAFVVIIALATALVQAVMALIGLGGAGGFVASLAGLILLPVMAVIGSFIGAAILFVIWKLMGSEEDFETAYRCAAYAYGYAPVAALVSGIPYVGTLVQVAWPVLLLALATIYVHGRKPGLAWGVFGTLGVVAVISMLSAEVAGRKIVSNLEQLSQDMEENYSEEDARAALEEAEKAFEMFRKEMEARKNGEAP